MRLLTFVSVGKVLRWHVEFMCCFPAVPTSSAKSLVQSYVGLWFFVMFWDVLRVQGAVGASWIAHFSDHVGVQSSWWEGANTLG